MILMMTDAHSRHKNISAALRQVPLRANALFSFRRFLCLSGWEQKHLTETLWNNRARDSSLIHKQRGGGPFSGPALLGRRGRGKGTNTRFAAHATASDWVAHLSGPFLSHETKPLSSPPPPPPLFFLSWYSVRQPNSLTTRGLASSRVPVLPLAVDTAWTPTCDLM